MTVDQHFALRPPALRAAFDALLEALAPEPPVRVEPLPATIQLEARRVFALVTPRRASLKVSVLLARELDDPRLARKERLAPDRYVATLVLVGPDEVDARLSAWLREAQALAA